MNKNGNQRVYVPVTTRLVSNDIRWVEESYLNKSCNMNSETIIKHRGTKNSCSVVQNDNFPLPHRQ